MKNLYFIYNSKPNPYILPGVLYETLKRVCIFILKNNKNFLVSGFVYIGFFFICTQINRSIYKSKIFIHLI